MMRGHFISNASLPIYWCIYWSAHIWICTETFITKYASGGGIISVFIASIIGIPMYIRPETMLPIAEALASKGMSLGTVVALIIGGAGASIPEVVLLSKLFKKNL